METKPKPGSLSTPGPSPIQKELRTSDLVSGLSQQVASVLTDTYRDNAEVGKDLPGLLKETQAIYRRIIREKKVKLTGMTMVSRQVVIYDAASAFLMVRILKDQVAPDMELDRRKTSQIYITIILRFLLLEKEFNSTTNLQALLVLVGRLRDLDPGFEIVSDGVKTFTIILSNPTTPKKIGPALRAILLLMVVGYYKEVIDEDVSGKRLRSIGVTMLNSILVFSNCAVPNTTLEMLQTEASRESLPILAKLFAS